MAAQIRIVDHEDFPSIDRNTMLGLVANSRYVHILSFCADWIWDQVEPLTKKSLVNFLNSTGLDAKNVEAFAPVILTLLDKQGFVMPTAQGREVVKSTYNQRMYECIKPETSNWRECVSQKSLAGTTTLPDAAKFTTAIQGQFDLFNRDLTRDMRVDGPLKIFTIVGCDDGTGSRDEVVTLPMLATKHLEAVRRALLKYDFGLPYRFHHQRVEIARTAETATPLTSLGNVLHLIRVQVGWEGYPPQTMSDALSDKVVKHPGRDFMWLRAELLATTIGSADYFIGKLLSRKLLTRNWTEFVELLVICCPLRKKATAAGWERYANAIENMFQLAVEKEPSTDETRTENGAGAVNIPFQCSHPVKVCNQIDGAMTPFRDLCRMRRDWTLQDYTIALAALNKQAGQFVLKGPPHNSAREFKHHGVDDFLITVTERVAAELRQSGVLSPTDFAPLFATMGLVCNGPGAKEIVDKRFAMALASFYVEMCAHPFDTSVVYDLCAPLCIFEHLTYNDIEELLANHPKFVTSVIILLDSTPAGQMPSSNVFIPASRLMILSSTRNDDVHAVLDDLALCCLRISRSSEAITGVRHMLFVAYVEHMRNAAWRGFSELHFAYLQDIVEGLIHLRSIVAHQKIVQYALIHILRLLISGSIMNMRVPASTEESIKRLLVVLDESDEPTTNLGFLFTLDFLCLRFRIARRFNAQDQAVRNLEPLAHDPFDPLHHFLRTPEIRYMVGIEATTWLLNTVCLACMQSERFYLSLAVALFTISWAPQEMKNWFGPLWDNIEFWLHVDATLAAESQICQNLILWQILGYVAQYEDGCDVILLHNLDRHILRAVKRVVEHDQLAMGTADSLRVLSHSLREAERDDIRLWATTIGDLAVSLMHYRPDIVERGFLDGIHHLAESGADISLVTYYAQMLGVRLRDDSPRAMGIDENLLALELPINVDSGELTVLAKTHICFALWNYLLRIVSPDALQTLDSNHEAVRAKIGRHIDLLRALTTDASVEPLVRETAVDTLDMARQAGLTSEVHPT